MTTKSAASRSSRPSETASPSDPEPLHGLPASARNPSSPAQPGLGTVSASNRQLLRWMFQFIRPVKVLVFVACFWVAAVSTTEVITNRVTGNAGNTIQALQQSNAAAGKSFFQWVVSGGEGARALRHIVADLAMLIVLMVGLRYLKEVANMRMSMTMVFYIREAVYDKLQRVGFGFHDAISSGQLINRALSDLQNVRSFVQTAVLVTLDIVLAVLINIAVIARLNGYIAVLSLVPLPIWTYYILRFSRKIQPMARSVMEAEDRNVSLITEAIAGVHVIKAFASERQEIGKYNGNCDTFFQRVLTRIRMFANFQPVIRSIAMGSQLSLFVAAGILMLTGKVKAGDVVFLSIAMNMVLGRLQQVSVINEQYQNAIVSARRLYEVLMAKPTVPEKPGAAPLPKGTGELVFEHVSFGYDAAKPVLKDVNFRAKGGSVIAIVGPTGAGKSTMVNLIARFYDPQQGRIVLDGVDLRDAQLASLRTQVAFVFQETYLFSATVAGNIAYGRPGITHGEIEAAARLAQAHEFIENLPKRYDTILGERGASLSGGQRQRLAIARAILTNPRVLILDDATASIDPETEDLIRRGMRFVMQSRTTFIIAHRISTVKQADLVLVLENGQITQMGTHASLMEQDGHYRDIAAAQLYGDEALADNGEAPSHMRRVQAPGQVAAAAAGAGRGEDEIGTERV